MACPRVNPQRRRTGLTLTELLVVIALIVVLASIVLVIARGVQATSYGAATKELMALLRNAAGSYHFFWGSWPPQDSKTDREDCKTVELVKAFRTTPEPAKVLEKIDRRFFASPNDELLLTDAWGSPILYVVWEGEPLFVSPGPDTSFGFGTSSNDRKRRSDNVYSRESVRNLTPIYE